MERHVNRPAYWSDMWGWMQQRLAHSSNQWSVEVGCPAAGNAPRLNIVKITHKYSGFVVMHWSWSGPVPTTDEGCSQIFRWLAPDEIVWIIETTCRLAEERGEMNGRSGFQHELKNLLGVG